MRKMDLEERLINFSVLIIEIAQQLPNSHVGNHLSKQLIRSGTSPALNYSEAMSAESRKDFVHKMKISLKELRETYTNLRIIQRAIKFSSPELLETALDENNQLISIFVTSIVTAQKNLEQEKSKKSSKINIR